MTSETPTRELNHALRFGVIWIVCSLIATPLVVLLLGPIMPPGNGSEQASEHVTDNTVLLALATPVMLLVLLYFLYAVVCFRQEKGAHLEGPVIHGNARIQTTWIVVSSMLVLGLATFGTVRLAAGGAGAGAGPDPVSVPRGPKLPVQVIAQQWAFTYRYPSYGGLETTQLVLPVGQMVELHVTSLDVIHSFWADQLGVKADANPHVDNIVFVRPTKLESFDVRCAELCGLWHGYMFDRGRIVTKAAFGAWITEQQHRFAPVKKYLPPYATRYEPEPAEE